jgi:hypothetical protein
MPADNTHHLALAARRRAERTHQRAVAALRRMDTAGQPITFDSLAREAGVSRSWLYTQQDLRAEVERLRERHPTRPTPAVPSQQRASDASLLRRLQTATERIQRIEHENRYLHQALAQALGERRAADILGQVHRRDTPNRRTSKIIGPC